MSVSVRLESSNWVCKSDQSAQDGLSEKCSTSESVSGSLSDNSSYPSCRRDASQFIPQASAAKLPLELIQQVFRYLPPADFNAARHACHGWMIASQQSMILRQMLKRGGWWGGVLAEIGPQAEQFSLVNPWYLSRRLARECALQSSWTGNGLARLDKPAQGNKDILYRTALSQTHTTDMTELSSCDSGPACDHACGLGFTVSVCGQYILVAEGCAIYVYQLESLNLRPITTVVCPRRVLATSMNTSSHRYTVAALLDSRMGVVCDLELGDAVNEPPSPQVYGNHTLASASNQSREGSISNHEIPEVSPASHGSSSDVRTIGPPGSSDITSIHVRSPHQSVSLLNASQEYPRQGINRTWRNIVEPFAHLQFEPGQAHSIPISPSPLSVYYSLCSPDDPPRCVAMCPTQRCIAFGCAAGIELHWIDSLSGKNLMKWFPLTAPSDFLYFLPGRPGIDNPNKLRLISSKAGPGQRGGVDRFSRASQRRRFGMSWGSLNFDRVGILPRGPDFDHYSAVPLSDGSHMIFTDPSSGSLFLGNDAPLGGPTKLLRKLVFVPPGDVACLRGSPPTIYSAGKDLTWGVRVAAMYGENLVLYCVPPDVYDDVSKHNKVFHNPTQEDCDECKFGEWRQWWSKSEFGVPISIRGVQIASVGGVVDIAVQSSTDLVIWTFSTDGTARTWQVGSGEQFGIMQRVVEQNGAVINVFDGEGDWIMRDKFANGLPPQSIPGAFFDQDGDVEMTMDEEEESWNTDEDGDGDVRMGGLFSQLDGTDEVAPLEVELIGYDMYPTLDIVRNRPRCSCFYPFFRMLETRQIH